MDTKLLGIYLSDHLAGSRGGLELARRIAGENRGNPVGDLLATFADELVEEREVLMEVMRVLEVPRAPLKEGVVWLVERLGRLKLNGRLLSYSPLSRVVELEGLVMGVTGKLSGWRSLRRLARTEPRLQAFDFEALAARAERQREGLERLRLQAVDKAFSDKAVPLRPASRPVEP